MQLPAIVLDDKSAARVGRGHLWIFSNEVKSAPAGLASGTEVAVMNGKGEFLGAAFYNRNALIVARVYARTAQPFTPEWLRNRLKVAARRRNDLLPERSSYRLVFSEADGIPGLIVDKYGSVLSVQFLTLAVEQRRAMIVEALQDLFSPAAIVDRSDSAARQYEGLQPSGGLLTGHVPEELVIDLNGLLFRVDPLDGQKTGIYLDQVENWSVIRPLAKGRKVLDLFSNVGGFSLNAAKYGADAVKAVDSSDDALSQLMFNASRNKLQNIRAKKSDAFLYVRSQPETFDIIICDPPPFAKSKKNLPAALRGYRELNRQCMKMLNPGGFLLTASCSAAVGEEDFDKMLTIAAGDASRRFRLLPGGGQPADHAPMQAMPESRYLKIRLLESVD